MKGKNILTLMLIALLIATVFAGCAGTQRAAALEDWATAVESTSINIATKMTEALESGDGAQILVLAIEYRDTLSLLIDQGKTLDQSKFTDEQKAKLTADIAVLETSLTQMNTIIEQAEQSPAPDAAEEPTEPAEETPVTEEQEPEQLTETPAA